MGCDGVGRPLRTLSRPSGSPLTKYTQEREGGASARPCYAGACRSAHLVFLQERFIRRLRIACAKDDVGPEVEVQLLLERVGDVDFGDDPEALLFQTLACACDGLREREIAGLALVVGHGGLLSVLNHQGASTLRAGM